MCERAALSQASGAIAWDLPVLGRAVEQPCLTVQSGTALRQLAHVHLHRATLDDVVEIDGSRTTPAGRTVCDLSREHGVMTGLAAADAALHRRLTTPDEFATIAALQRRWPGARAMRFVISFADGRAESPLESISRLRIAQHGLPAPEPQVLICDEHGQIITRSDFYWDEFGVIGECDGALKWDNDPTARDERDEKTHLLEGLGLGVVRWGWADARRFGLTARRLRYAYERGARPGSLARRWGIVRRPAF